MDCFFSSCQAILDSFKKKYQFLKNRFKQVQPMKNPMHAGKSESNLNQTKHFHSGTKYENDFNNFMLYKLFIQVIMLYSQTFT